MNTRKFYLTPDEFDEYLRLRLTIKAFETARDSYMATIRSDMKFLRDVGIHPYPTQAPPVIPGFNSTDDQLTEEEVSHV